MKKIMILSSSRTGYGHQSIADALTEQLAQFGDIQVETVEGLLFFGRLGLKAGGMYGPITRGGKDSWKLVWDLSVNNPEFLTQNIVTFMHDRFMQRLQKDPPNLILSIHPLFSATIPEILGEHHIYIPFVTLLADLVDIHPLWVDTRADCILCPTDESLDSCRMLGAPAAILKRCGFPVRGIFTETARNREHRPYTPGRPLECLLMSGGEGSGNLRVLSKLILDHLDARVTVLCGRNQRLKDSLEKYLDNYGGRVQIFGFRDNVQDFMLEADLAILRGSPNSMMEAVVCNVPMIITGALPGQEARNPEFAQMHGLGVTCRNKSQIVPLIRGLLENGAEGLNRIAEKQRYFRNLDNAAEIARFLAEKALDAPPPIPDFENRSPVLTQAAELYRRIETLALKDKPSRKD